MGEVPLYFRTQSEMTSGTVSRASCECDCLERAGEREREGMRGRETERERERENGRAKEREG